MWEILQGNMEELLPFLVEHSRGKEVDLGSVNCEE